MSRARWLLLQSSMLPVENTSTLLRDVHVPFDCEFLIAQDIESEVRLSEIYRVSTRKPLRIKFYATWSLELGLRAPLPGNLHSRRNDLEGLVIQGVTANSSSTSMYVDNNNDLKLDGGFFGHIWNLLEHHINFTTKFSTPTDVAWGSKEKNGSWNGMIGMLHRGEAHVAVVMFTTTPERQTVVDFTVPLMFMRYSVYFREREIMDPNWKSFVAPFSNNLWFTIAAAIAIFALGLVVMGRCVGGCDVSFSDSLLILLAIFTQRAQVSLPSPVPHPPLEQTSSRMLISTAQFTALVLMAAYSGTLVSFLTTRRTALPFINFQELLKDGSYQLGVIAKSAEYDYFANSTSRLMLSIYEQLMKPYPGNIVQTEYDGLNKACGSRYVFLSPSYFMIDPLNRRNCSITEIPIDLFKATVSVAIAKGSPYRGLINYNLQKLRRVGILKRLQLAMPPATRLSESNQPALEVHLEHVIPLLVILLTGAIIAMIVIVLELWHRRHKRRRQKLWQ